MSAYKFSNLLGAVYAAGNVAYSPDGNWLYSPIGCSLSVFDLVKYAYLTDDVIELIISMTSSSLIK